MCLVSLSLNKLTYVKQRKLSTYKLILLTLIFINNDKHSIWNNMKNKKQSTIIFLVILFNTFFCTSIFGQWQQLKGPYSEYIIQKIFRKADTIYAFSDWEFYKSIDNGNSWSYHNYLQEYNDFSKIISITHKDSIFAAYTNIGMFMSNDYGKSWDSISFEYCDSIYDFYLNKFVYNYPSILKIEFFGDDLYATSNCGLYRKLDGDTMFSKIDTNGLELRNVFVEDSLILCDYQNGVQVSNDFGNSWLVSSFSPMNVGMGLYKHQNSIYSCRVSGLFVSHDQGINWTDTSTLLPSTQQVRNLIHRDDLLFLNIEDSTLYFSNDYGSSWATLNKGLLVGTPSNPILDIYKENDTLYLGFLYGGIFKSTNLGQKWKHKSVGMQNALISQIQSLGDTLFAVASHQGPGLFRSYDGGQNWENINSSQYYVTNYIKLDQNKLYLSDTSGKLYCSTDFGDSWNPIPLPTQIWSIEADGNKLFGRMPDNWILKSYDSGQTWDSLFLLSQFTDYVKDIRIFDDDVFASAYGLYYSSDSGQTFSNIQPGNYPYFNNLDYDGTNLFAPTQKGLYYTNDKGLSWDTLLQPPPFSSTYFGDVKIIGDYVFIVNFTDTILHSKIGTFDWKRYTSGLRSRPIQFHTNDHYLFVTTYGGVYQRPLLEAVNIDEHSVINNEIIIYPNPVNDIVNIYIPNTTKNSIDIHIYDIQGREVKNVQMNPLQKEISIDCSEFNPGMYLLLFKDSDYLESKKLIIN